MSKVVKRGRPSIPADQRRIRFVLRTRPEYIDLLNAVERQTGENRTQIMDRAIRALMARYPHPDDPPVE